MLSFKYLSSISLACCLGAASAADISFQEVSGAESGLQKIMQDWKADEFKKQNGNFGSHGWWPWGLTAFDYDNDGDIDLLPAHHGKPGSILIKSEFSESGKLSFKNVTSELTDQKLPGADKKPKIWDFNGDGFLDISGWSDEAKRPPSFLNMGGKSLKKLDFVFHPISHHKDEQVRDLNGDGYLDFAGVHRGRDLSKVWDPAANTFVKWGKVKQKPAPKVPQEFLDYFAELKKKMAPPSKRHPKGYLANRFLGVKYLTDYDINSDGHMDVVAQSTTAYGWDLPAAYFLNDGKGNYVDKTEELGLPKEGSPVFIKDVTGDGLVDLFIIKKGHAGFYMATKEGKFVKPENADLNANLKEGDSYMHKFFPVDFDSDGDYDLVISLPRSGRESIYENKGNGQFKLIMKFSGWDSEPIAICDINNDGLVDIAVGGSGTKAKRSSKKNADITIFINNTKTDNNYCNIYPTMPAPNPYAVGAKITAYPAGKMDVKGAVPIVDQAAYPDASPVRVGLGSATEFDLRVTFPDGTVREFKKVKASSKLKVAPAGKLAILK